ncbi:hypothetical protein ACFWQ6_26885 [Streptomyces coelicoflavus]|uniref:hypothetical protein n=1 Tax=Streptomyces TaxID=1883 RepID=UPI0012914D13|nr:MULTISPECIES: hypothetical protein [Streptomyces]KAF2775745.1 hypothetical protein STPH1_0402 [Streptomyces sp. OM5714]MCX5041057.1 hypothetical protein [Streptomyces coelicoflavus]MDI6516557.1 hypothetical protein [Streptomyces coelicoflavus]NHI05041.1 hypothetical protein [Streptomyces sp. KO7888]QFX79895.1 hypothetical protein GEV49_02340 [Streptomyces sp. SYP-A7193]
MSRNGEHDRKQPETAVEEVLREIEESRPRDAESDEGGHRGEAGDATSPNTGAQKDAEGE